MSSPLGMYGGYKYESAPSRTLGSINRESYQRVWDDQTKFMSKVVSDISYMAAYQRKMQRGIDDANQNILQQLQSMITDFTVLFGGAGDTGLDFGDLKYVLQAIAGLFGFADENGNFTIPVNLFNVAWHFFSNFILPVNNFHDAIDFLVDSLIATVLDLFGEVPILGDALQQLAVIISDIRDLLGPIVSAIEAFFDAFNITLGDIDGISSFFGPFKPIVDALFSMLDGINLPDFSAVIRQIIQLGQPFIDVIVAIINIATQVVKLLTGSGNVNSLLASFGDIANAIVPGEGSFGFLDIGFMIINLFLSPTNLLLGPNSPLNAANIFGFLRRIFVPASSITSKRINLAPTPTFGPGSIADNDEGWDDDGTSKTADSTGSAKIIADGTFHALTTGKTPDDIILINPGKAVDITVPYRYEDYTGTGESLEVRIIPFYSGEKGTAITVATVTPTSADVTWAADKKMTASWTGPEAVDGIQLQIMVRPSALTGEFEFDNIDISQSADIDPGMVSGLPGILEELFARGQNLINAILNTLTGGSGIVGTITGLISALQSIPNILITGILGGGNIGASLMNILNAIVGGAVGAPGGEGATPAQAFSIFNILGSNSFLGQLAYNLLGIRNSEPVANGLMATSDSNIPFVSANTYLEVTQSASLCVTHRVSKSRPLGLVAFLGYMANPNPSAVYLNVRKIDPTTGVRTLIHHAEIKASFPVGTTSAARNWIEYEFDAAHVIAQEQAEEYEYQLVPVGGSIWIRGVDTGDAIPDRPHTNVKTLAAVRNETTPTSPATTIAKAAVVSTTKIMFVEMAIDTEDSAQYHDPVLYPLDGTADIVGPKWAVFADLVVIGRGGSGSGGFPLLGGRPGSAGQWNATTAVRGIHWTGDFAVHYDQATNTLSMPGTDVTVSATNGANGAGANFPGQLAVAIGAPVFNFKGYDYVGGGDQRAPGGHGIAPGGPGNGGHFLSGFLQGGGTGAPGGAFVRFRQVAVEGEEVGPGTGDLTPPTPPDVPILLDVTSGGATFDVVGGSD